MTEKVFNPFTGQPDYTGTPYTDEQAQDAVGNAVGTGLDYDDTTGAISVDLTETTAVVTDPATQARNTVQPTADVTGLTVQKYYDTPTAILPSALTVGTLHAWYIADTYVSGDWADSSGNGYTLTIGGGGASKVADVINGYGVIRFTGQNHNFRNTAGFTISQPMVFFMVAKTTTSGTTFPGSTWVDVGTAPSGPRVELYYEQVALSSGWSIYAGSAHTATNSKGATGRFNVIVAKVDGANSFTRCNGDTEATGDPGANSMTGITVGNAQHNLAGAYGDLAEIFVVSSPSDAEIDGLEAYLANKYNLELVSNAQTANIAEWKGGTGEILSKITKEGTLTPTLFNANSSALDIGLYSQVYKKWRFMPLRIEIGDGTYDVAGQTGLYQNGWTLSAPTSTTGSGTSLTLGSMSNYTSQSFSIRQPGNGVFDFNTGTCRFNINSINGSHLGAHVLTQKGVLVRGMTGQTLALQQWEDVSGNILAYLMPRGLFGIKSTIATGIATHAITGTINPTASTAVVGVGTLFTTELTVGDRITVSGETRTVVAITDNLNLTVDTAFSDTANDTSPDKLPAIFVLRTSAGSVKAIMNDLGNIGIGTVTPTCTLDVAGIVKTAGRRRAVTTKTDDYVATTADEVIVCNKATAMTITLPAATGLGQTFSISSIGVGAVTIDGNASETINGATSVIIYQYESITVVDYGTGVWTII